MVERKKGRIRPEDTEEEGPIELSLEEDARARQAVSQADTQIGFSHEARFSCRWTADALKLIRHVAEAMGVPYQTYIKQASYRCALEDLARMHAAVTGHATEDLSRLKQLALAAAAELPEFANPKYSDQWSEPAASQGMLVREQENNSKSNK